MGDTYELREAITKEDLKNMTAMDFIDYMVAICHEHDGEAAIEFDNAFMRLTLIQKEDGTYPELTSQKYLM